MLENDKLIEGYAKYVCEQSIKSLREFIAGCKEDGLDKTEWYRDFLKDLKKVYKDG